jgi:exopolysaccharide production protein ExoZ
MINLLQAYRGCAALLVVLFHASARIKLLYGIETDAFLDFFDFGDAGIQFFFVLSGFIIYHVHRNDIGRPNRLSSFLKKRIFRIYPIYIFVTLLVFPAWYFLPSIGFPYHKDLGAFLFSLLLIPQNHAPHLAVAWTLTHEMLFYLVFALAIVHRTAGSIIFIGWFTITTVAHLAMQMQLVFPLAFFFSVNNLLFGIGVGAAMLAGRVSFRDRQAISIIFTGILLFLSTGLYANSLKHQGLANGHLPDQVILLFGFASFLLVLPANNTYVEKFIKRRRMMILLGNASYSIYLLHVPALSLFIRCFSFLNLEIVLPYSVLFLSATVLAVVSGILLHQIIEQPMLLWLRAKWIHGNARIPKATN